MVRRGLGYKFQKFGNDIPPLFQSEPQGEFISPNTIKSIDPQSVILRPYEGQKVISNKNLVIQTVCQNMLQ